jgi:hypothetical protein
MPNGDGDYVVLMGYQERLERLAVLVRGLACELAGGGLDSHFEASAGGPQVGASLRMAVRGFLRCDLGLALLGSLRFGGGPLADQALAEDIGGARAVNGVFSRRLGYKLSAVAGGTIDGCSCNASALRFDEFSLSVKGLGLAGREVLGGTDDV